MRGGPKQGGTRLRVNEDRLCKSFDALSSIGATPDGGVHRPAFSGAHLLAERWFLEEAARAGLETKIDGAGNHSAILRRGPDDGSTVLLGSHLDTVPYGGRFDGALGVAAALEVLQTVKERKLPLRFNLEAISFVDEEGRFIDLFGSQSVVGTIRVERIENAGRNPVFKEALDGAHLDVASVFSAKRNPSEIAGYLELHIEQGPRLAEQNIDIGIVTSIVGIRTFRVKFMGRSDHAGTTPMDKRLDAAQGASSLTLGVRRTVTENFPGAVATVGNMIFAPGASNVVPQTVTLLLEFRAGSESELNKMEGVLLGLASKEAEKFGLGVETENIGFAVPATMNSEFQNAIARASGILGFSHVYIPSYAGHDAQSMARICPAGMIFVPSQGGFSHSARELTTWQDCVNGANVLLQTILELNNRCE